jgi:hypothetical protein
MGYLERSCEFLERIIAEAARNLSEESIESGSSLSSLMGDTGSGHLVALKNQRKLSKILKKNNKEQI